MTGRNDRGTILFGGSGFLGGAILDAAPDIISVGRSKPRAASRHIPVTDLRNLSVLDGIGFDRVICAIGSSDRRGMERDRPAPDEPSPFDYHVSPLLAVLEYVRHRRIRKFVSFSTALLYDPARIAGPINESTPIDPFRTRYVLSQHVAEEVSRFFGRSIPTLNVRLSNLYGPSRRPRYDLIDGLLRQVVREGKASVRSGRTVRDFVFVRDAVQAILLLAHAEGTGVINLATGHSVAVSEVASAVAAVSGCPVDDLDQPVEPPGAMRFDIRALQAAVNWAPAFTLEAGIRETFERMKESW